MKRNQLEHAIRTACQIIGHSEIIIVGSQAILGTYDETELPQSATMSMEVDVLPIASTHEETLALANMIEGVAGELSLFESTHGFSIDGVDLTTSILPLGWQDRLVRLENSNTPQVFSSNRFAGLCLERHDLCVAKICAFREKDKNFVLALIEHRLVDPYEIKERLNLVPTRHAARAKNALAWLAPFLD